MPVNPAIHGTCQDRPQMIHSPIYAVHALNPSGLAELSLVCRGREPAAHTLSAIRCVRLSRDAPLLAHRCCTRPSSTSHHVNVQYPTCMYALVRIAVLCSLPFMAPWDVDCHVGMEGDLGGCGPKFYRVENGLPDVWGSVGSPMSTCLMSRRIR